MYHPDGNKTFALVSSNDLFKKMRTEKILGEYVQLLYSQIEKSTQLLYCASTKVLATSALRKTPILRRLKLSQRF
jgi:hypothetical protein